MNNDCSEKLNEHFSLDEINELMILISEPKKLKDKIGARLNSELLSPLWKSNEACIKLLYEIDYGLAIESKNLLNQSYMTLKNVHKLLNEKQLVDANVLLRSAYENLLMGVMINYDERIYSSFKNIEHDNNSKKEQDCDANEEEYVTEQFVRNRFKEKLKEINPDMYGSISNTKLQDLLDEIYNMLSLYTHSTLVVNTMVEVCRNNDADLVLHLAKFNVYFVELLLYSCLKFITKDNSYSINDDYILVGVILLFSNIPIDKYDKIKLKEYNDMLYPELNAFFFHKDDGKRKSIINDLEQMKELEINKEKVIRIIKELLK